jgi:hypothetical protein
MAVSPITTSGYGAGNPCGADACDAQSGPGDLGSRFGMTPCGAALD